MSNPTGNMSAGTSVQAALCGHLSEMFCSVQGEGLFVGERQIFVRTAGCAATCSWCDTVYSKVRSPRFVIHAAGEGEARRRDNPVALEDVLDDIGAMAREHAPVAGVSITGGEPLEQPGFVAALARRLRERGFRIHLETAGLHAAALESVVGAVDVVAMDIKLPSATGVDHWDAHARFLDVIGRARTRGASGSRRVGASGCTVFVKVVVDLAASVAEIERAAALIAAYGRDIPMILQPESETLFGRRATREGARALLDLIDSGARAAAAFVESVRVIPQTHKVLRLR